MVLDIVGGEVTRAFRDFNRRPVDAILANKRKGDWAGLLDRRSWFWLD